MASPLYHLFLETVKKKAKKDKERREAQRSSQKKGKNKKVFLKHQINQNRKKKILDYLKTNQNLSSFNTNSVTSSIFNSNNDPHNIHQNTLRNQQLISSAGGGAFFSNMPKNLFQSINSNNNNDQHAIRNLNFQQEALSSREHHNGHDKDLARITINAEIISNNTFNSGGSPTSKLSYNTARNTGSVSAKKKSKRVSSRSRSKRSKSSKSGKHTFPLNSKFLNKLKKKNQSRSRATSSKRSIKSTKGHSRNMSSNKNILFMTLKDKMIPPRKRANVKKQKVIIGSSRGNKSTRRNRTKDDSHQQGQLSSINSRISKDSNKYQKFKKLKKISKLEEKKLREILLKKTFKKGGLVEAVQQRGQSKTSRKR